jgi:hypothetical protein
MKSTKNKTVNTFIIGTFVSLYLTVSIISTIHVIDFFRLSNPEWLAISLAIGFELGAAACLAALITLDKMNKTMVWALFIVITLMQMQGNMYYAYTYIKDYQGWVELFNLVEWEPIAQKRLLAGVSGAILPLVALGFIKSLVDYIKPDDEVAPIRVEDLDVIAEEINHPRPNIEEEVESIESAVNSYDSLQEEIKEWDVTLNDGIEDEFEETVENVIEDKVDGLEMGQIVTEENYPPIEVDVINVKKKPGLIDSTRAPETMTVYDKNKNNYVPIKDKWVC